MKSIKNKFGLTLIELLAVIAIIAILFVLLIPQISSGINKAKLTGIQNDFRSFQLAAKNSEIFNNEVVFSEESFNKNLDKGLKFTNNISAKKNPFGNDYELIISDLGFTISTLSENQLYNLTFTFEGDSNNTFENESTSIVKGTISSSPPNSKIVGIPKENTEFYYTEYYNGISITSYKGTNPNLVIPSEIDGVKVFKIGYLAFYPKSVNPRGKSNVKLESLFIPEGIEIIDAAAFQYNNLKTLILPDSLVTLGNEAFGQNKLTSVSIGKNLKNLSTNPFVFQPNIIFTISTNNKHLQTDSTKQSIYSQNYSFIHVCNDSTFNQPEFKKVKIFGTYSCLKSTLNSLSLHEGVEIIKSYAFAEGNFVNITLPSTLKTIEEGAFSYSKITDVVIPDSVESIGSIAFYINPLNTYKLLGDTKFNPDSFPSSSVRIP